MRHTATIIAAAVLSLVVTSAACGDAAPVAPTSGRILYSVSGGIAGIDETWEIDANGTVTAPDGTSLAIDPEAAGNLFIQIEEAGFFDLDAEYLPDDPCCDRFTYGLSLLTVTRDHSVVTMDGTPAVPEALTTSLALVQDAISSAD